MPRTKKTTEQEVSPVAATEQPKRKRAATPKSATAATPKPATAASHKHATKKTAQTPEPEQQVSTIAHEEIARLAYSYWEERGYAGGSAEDDWLRAERELFVLAQNS